MWPESVRSHCGAIENCLGSVKLTEKSQAWNFRQVPVLQGTVNNRLKNVRGTMFLKGRF